MDRRIVTALGPATFTLAFIVHVYVKKIDVIDQNVCKNKQLLYSLTVNCEGISENNLWETWDTWCPNIQCVRL